MVLVIWNLDEIFEIIFDEADDFIRFGSDHCPALSLTNPVMFGYLMMGLMLFILVMLYESIDC